jgi:hypothetical protein
VKARAAADRAPLTWPEIAVAFAAVLLVAAPMAYLLARALARLAFGALR